MPQVNPRYNNTYVECQQTHKTVDPYGNPMWLYQGQQFKYHYFDIVEAPLCNTCGTSKKRYVYFIDAYAHCKEGEYIWPENNTGKTIAVFSDYFIETDSLKYPPIINHIQDELSGAHTEQFLPPEARSVPRKGGLWVEDPWWSKLDS